MTETTFRPFWSFHIQKTEAWLASKAEEGWRLTGFQPKTSRFTFTRAQPEHATFAVSFDRSRNHPLPHALEEDGWHVASRRRKWAVYANEKPSRDVKTTIVRDGLESRNSRIAAVWWIYFLFIVLSLSMQAAIFLPLYLSDAPVTVTRVESPLWIVTYTALFLQILVTVLGVYQLLALKRESARLFQQKLPAEDTDGAGVKKHRMKPGWMYAPDKLEAWLERQENDGWHLESVRPGGIRFRFTDRRPAERYAYEVLFEGRADAGAHQFHEEAGWEKVYASGMVWQKWSIWRKACRAGEPKPVMHDTAEDRSRAAMRVTRTYTILFLPIVMLFALNYFSFILPNALEEGSASLSGLEWFNVTVYPFVMIFFFSSVVRVWLYYFRERKPKDSSFT
ncbi:DUF2812 domain-containing protein [Alkalicoccus urumqiensis]|uniref:DUF2812 domain-containing protein n=1 Tax=Alkalicoccus urumqiensis TaxID=1548213 RepID=A0A2P6MJI0_ALKUR|nr:DUF2812 domain-containing protein [Alkalicoccus urumqiensis]PRO66444.1 hypothetical protein C6I21_03640 [Alkalicoccus urumqiensis]